MSIRSVHSARAVRIHLSAKQVARGVRGRPDRHSGEVPVAYIVPAHPGRFDEAELLAWAGTAISEPTGGRKTAGRRWHRP